VLLSPAPPLPAAAASFPLWQRGERERQQRFRGRADEQHDGLGAGRGHAGAQRAQQLLQHGREGRRGHCAAAAGARAGAGLGRVCECR
jgi:hypothetical protein